MLGEATGSQKQSLTAVGDKRDEKIWLLDGAVGEVDESTTRKSAEKEVERKIATKGD